jgi:hypothetical protein
MTMQKRQHCFRARTPGVERPSGVRMAVRMQSTIISGSERKLKCAAERTKDRCKPLLTKGMPGVWLNRGGHWEGAVRNASFEAVSGKTRRTEF